MGLLKMWILGGHQSSRKNVRSIKISENQQKLDWMRKTVRICLHIRKFSCLLWNNQRSFHHTCNGTIRTFHMHIICFLFTTETEGEVPLASPTTVSTSSNCLMDNWLHYKNCIIYVVTYKFHRDFMGQEWGEGAATSPCVLWSQIEKNPKLIYIWKTQNTQWKCDEP